MRHYKRPLRATLTALFMLLPGIALSGPFEDGVAAYDRGDYTTAIRLFRPLAEQGIASAQYNLGYMLAHGKGAPQNYGEALEWYRKAADQEYAAAQNALRAILMDYTASRAAEQARDRTLNSALAAGDTLDEAWKKAALAAGRAAADGERAGGRTEHEAMEAARQAEEQVRLRAPTRHASSAARPVPICTQAQAAEIVSTNRTFAAANSWARPPERYRV
jgi:TPR repeat protein